MRFLRDVSVTLAILMVSLTGLYFLMEIINYAKAAAGIY